MRTSGGVGSRQQWLIGVIFIAILIDGILLAIVRANFLHDHGYDAGPQRPAVARPLAP
ncbi:MAG TPA: hypothetical protein VEY94_06320 [Patescibacteria group bacterium]|nr:hypothetical protein [Patescibacteria group bacterium]